MIDLSSEHFSEPLCRVNVDLLAAWLSLGGVGAPWIIQPDNLRKPQRLLDPRPDLTGPLIDKVLTALGVPCKPHEIVLSRMQPRQFHDFHQDQQGVTWLTRIHVPITSTIEAWHEFEGAGMRFHMLPGWAYTFNAVKRHAFGNDGTTPRVHLIFDVMRI